MFLLHGRRIAGVFAAALSIACGASTQGRVDRQGYHHADLPYRVNSDENGRLMKGAWALENFYEPKGYGGKASGTFLEKNAPGYMTLYSLDTTGDGFVDFRVERHLYDLRFEHRQHDGVISLSSFPISDQDREKRLDVFVERYLGHVARTSVTHTQSGGGTTFHLGDGLLGRVISKQKVQLAGQMALLCELEIFDRDEKRLDPHSAREKLELLVLHLPFEFRIRHATFGGLLVASYRNSPSYFEDGLDDFHHLLGRIELKGESGFRPVAPVSSAVDAEVEASSTVPPKPEESLVACRAALEGSEFSAAAQLCSECSPEVLDECRTLTLNRAETMIVGSALTCEKLHAIRASLARFNQTSEAVSEEISHACESHETQASRGAGRGRPGATPGPAEACAELARQGQLESLKTRLTGLQGEDKHLCQRAIVRAVGALALEPGRTCTDLQLMKASLATLELKSTRIEYKLSRCKERGDEPAPSPTN